jgi:hypothetical protein
MLLVQKLLNNKLGSIKTPISDRSGLLVYTLNKKDYGEVYHFVYYNWESGKNHPGYYAFRFYSVGDGDDHSFTYLLKNTEYKSWCDFFELVETIKTQIVKNKDSVVPKNRMEAVNILWRAFLKSQDYSLATVFKALPQSFYNSIDDDLTAEQQKLAREDCLKYMKQNYFVLYNSWAYFFEVDIESKFCEWFYNYVAT